MRGLFRAIGWGLLAGLFMACLVIGLPGCSLPGDDLQLPPTPEIIKFGPDEYGVVCYKHAYYGATFSCVQVQEGRK